MNALTAYFIGGLKRLFAGLERVRGGLQPGFDRWLNRTTKLDEDGDRQGFVADSDYAILQQEPLRAQVLLKSIGIATALFLMWAAVSRVDEVTRGEGKVIPSRQLQVLQSLDGGVVDEILVHEGDVVEPEQILLRIDQTRFVSSVRESRVQYTALAAKAARLRALTEGTPFTLPDDVLKEDPKTAEEERRLYESRRSELETTTSIAR
ncbi:MAG TPA: biotin/lipoyl-binding protein, partial [Accumulibacter sp.]|nr:biotin/lipoyl-binding protein [Accumulibacter sp.]